MKKLKNWGIMMLVAMAVPMMVACGSDGDGENSGGNISYTQEEIVKMLAGKWAISGYVEWNSTQPDYTPFKGDYTGTIEFSEDQKYKVVSSGMPYKDWNGETSYISLEDFLGHDKYFEDYSILRKEGKAYITFRTKSLNPYNFQIVSISKNSFKFVEDEYYDYEYEDYFGNGRESGTYRAHLQMTIISN